MKLHFVAFIMVVTLFLSLFLSVLSFFSLAWRRSLSGRAASLFLHLRNSEHFLSRSFIADVISVFIHGSDRAFTLVVLSGAIWSSTDRNLVLKHSHASPTSVQLRTSDQSRFSSTVLRASLLYDLRSLDLTVL